jgi:hypothetical protein
LKESSWSNNCLSQVGADEMMIARLSSIKQIGQHIVSEEASEIPVVSLLEFCPFNENYCAKFYAALHGIFLWQYLFQF